MSRLRKLKKLEENEEKKINKTASAILDLDNQILNSGDVIGISVRTVNWNPWYQVYLDYGNGVSSFYDGPDAEKAFRMYKDLLTAFKGVRAAEDFNKNIPKYKKQMEMFIDDSKKKGLDDYYHNLILKRPSFLGYF